MGVCIVGVLVVGSKPFAPQGETRELGVSSWLYGTLPGWRFWWECVSAFPTHFEATYVCIFSFPWCVGITQLVSQFLSEEISLCIAADLVWKDECLGGLLCHNLGLEPPQIFKSIVNLEAWLLVAYPVSILSFLEKGPSFIWDFRVYRYETVCLR